MPLYLFEYYDNENIRHEFQDFYSVNEDFNAINSPCGLYKACKIISDCFAMQGGMTATEKNSGTTKQRVEYSKFMKAQKEIRKKNYSPDTREHKSNEIWTGKEGLDGITELPISKKVTKKKI